MSQTYFGNLDRIGKAYEPALKGIGRYNLELAGLAARRAQAWLEIPARLGRCKTPQDLLGEQMRFWQTAAAQYMQSGQLLAAALGAIAVVPGLNGAADGKSVAPARDFITFPDAPDPAEQGEQKRGDRRAA